MIKKMKKFFPLGFSVEIELAVIIVLLWIAGMWSSTVFFRDHWEDVFANCYDGFENWFHYVEDSQMPEFLPMLRNCFDIFWGYCIAMIGMVVYNYRYHCSEYKSIYLMRRLPNRWELHRRCIVVPLLGLAFAGILIMVLFYFYHTYYMSFVPPLEYELDYDL